MPDGRPALAAHEAFTAEGVRVDLPLSRLRSSGLEGLHSHLTLRPDPLEGFRPLFWRMHFTVGLSDVSW